MLNISEFAKAKNSRGLWEFAVTFFPFLILIFGGANAFERGHFLIASVYWLLAMLFHARLFVLTHDCGHFSLVESRWLNNVLGYLCALTYGMPFFLWRELHHRHHKNQGHLGRRGLSFDLWILTRQEYVESSRLRQFAYRAYHYPLVTFLFGGVFFFVFLLRVPFEKFSARVKTNLVVVDGLWGLAVFSYVWFPGVRSLWNFLASVALFNFAQAIWYFYHQHVHPKAPWYSNEAYTNEKVSLSGSTYIVFPSSVSWFSAKIGYHHVHHLNLRVPFYQLENSHQKILREIKENEFSSVIEIQWIDLFKNLSCHLWDESQQRWMSFSDLAKTIVEPDLDSIN